MQSPGNRALLFVLGKCVIALRFVSSPMGLKNPHQNIGTVGPLSIPGEGGGEGLRAHGVTVGSGRDGLAGLALRAACSLRSRSVQLAVASCRTLGRGFSSLPQACYMRKKSPHFHASSSLNMAVREGLTRCARPSGSLFAALSGCPTGCRQLSNPQSRVLIPPAGVLHAKKKSAFSCELFFKYGGEGGIDSLRSPFGQPTHCVRGLSNWLCQLSNPRSRVLIPPAGVLHAKKKPAFSCELFFKYGGEGGIRTLDTLPYTHFPGVLLQPLGHLTILFCCLSSRGQRGATIGSQAKSVKQIFCINARSVKQ